MNAPATLLALHEQLADKFLATAVIVDDQALPAQGAVDERRDEQEHEEEQTAAPHPPRDAEPSATGPVGRGVTGDLVPGEIDEGRPHDLDAPAVIDAFARAGIACAVLSPKKDDSVERTLESLLPVSTRSDLLITDWVQHNDNGARTRALITNLLRRDDPPRHRVIAVYTGQTDLAQVHDDLKAIIEKEIIGGELIVDEDDLSVVKGPVRAVVIGKPNEPDPPPGQTDRRVDYADLPARMRQEFARSTVGLVAGAAVAALTAVRTDTHRVLARLDDGLDAGYVGHRLAQATPSDAEEHLSRIVLAELATLATEHGIGASAGPEACALWLADRADPGIAPDARRWGQHIGSGQLALTADDMYLLLEKGLGNPKATVPDDFQNAASATQLSNKIRKSPTDLLLDDADRAHQADMAFTALMHLQTAYRTPDRALRLGTIVASDEHGLLLCLQPVCDAIRLKGPRAFPFVRLTSVAPRAKAALVVPDSDGDLTRVKIDDSPHRLLLLDFAPGSDGTVRPTAAAGRHLFDTHPVSGAQTLAPSNPDDGAPGTGGRRRVGLYRRRAGRTERGARRQPGPRRPAEATGRGQLQWLAQLRPDYAQRVALQVAEKLGRIGVDEPEVLRLSS